jgi:hypothetical protein
MRSGEQTGKKTERARSVAPYVTQPVARRGFAILWILIAIALAAILVAASSTYLDQLNDDTSIATTAAMLKQVAVAVDSFTNVVKDGGNHGLPGLFSQLTTPIVNGGPTSCTTTTVTSNDVSSWATGGPYSNRLMPTSGLNTPLGRIVDTAFRADTATARRTANSQSYFIVIRKVDIKLARALDLYVDVNAGSAADTVWYTPAAGASDSTVTLGYRSSSRRTPAEQIEALQRFLDNRRMRANTICPHASDSSNETQLCRLPVARAH